MRTEEIRKSLASFYRKRVRVPWPVLTGLLGPKKVPKDVFFVLQKVEIRFKSSFTYPRVPPGRVLYPRFLLFQNRVLKVF